MRKPYTLGSALPWIAAMVAGCGNTPSPVAEAPSDSRESASAESSAPSKNAAPTGGAAGRPNGAAGSASVTNASGGPPDAGAAVGGRHGDPGDEADGGPRGTMAGSGATAGEPSEPSVPTPVESPQIWGFGIGVSDVAGATEYFKDVMRVEVEKEAVKRDGWTETMFFSTSAPRGGRLSLLAFDDMRDTSSITAKLIWKVKETAPIDEVASKYPFYMKYLDVNYVMFEGPDRYIQEISNKVIGMERPREVTAWPMLFGAHKLRDEVVLQYPGHRGASLVLMTVPTPAYRYKYKPIKSVHLVPDLPAILSKLNQLSGVRSESISRYREHAVKASTAVRDPDGYTLELVETGDTPYSDHPVLKLRCQK